MISAVFIVDGRCVAPCDAMLHIVAALAGQRVVAVRVAVGVNIVAKGSAQFVSGSFIAVCIDAFDKLLNILRPVGTQHAGRCSTAHLA